MLIINSRIQRQDGLLANALLKKEVLYSNNITSLAEYITLVEDWIEFYNTSRIRSKKK